MVNQASSMARKKIIVDVITASDLNPKYLDCVKYFIDAWNILGASSEIEYFPRVAIIGENIPQELFGLEKHLVLVEGNNFNPAFVAQNIRLFLPGSSGSTYVMTSDVDMLPGSTRMFDYGIRKLESGADFLILRNVLSPGQFPICYAIARPTVWQSLFGPNHKTQDSCTFLKRVAEKYDPNFSYSGIHGGEGWSIDQELLYWKATSIDPELLALVDDEQTKHRRLDRAHHRFPINWFVALLIPFSYYTDYHIHHPIQRNIRFIKFYLKLLRIQVSVRRKDVSHDLW